MTDFRSCVFTFSSSVTRYTISISLVDDNIVEPTEALTAHLVFTNTPSPLRVTLHPAVANITIFDNDSESLHVLY